MSSSTKAVLALVVLAGLAAGRAPAAAGELWLRLPEQPAEATYHVLVDGEAVEASLGSPRPGAWRTVVVFDRLFSDPRAFRDASVRLHDRADALTRLGPVELWVLDDEMRRVLPPSSDVAVVADAITWLGLREVVEDLQLGLRRELSNAEEDADRAALAAEAEAAEAGWARRQADALLRWIGDQNDATPTVLILVSGGVDGPLPFYRPLLGAGVDLEGWPGTEEVAQALAARSWMAVPYLPRVATEVFEGAKEDAEDAAPQAVDLIIGPDGRLVDRTAVGVDAKKLFHRDRESDDGGRESTGPLLLDPRASLEPMARATGTAVVEKAEELDSMLSSLAAARPVRWSGSTGSSGGSSVEVWRDPLPGSGSKRLAGPRKLPGGTPLAVVEARARELLDSGSEDGSLEIAAVLEQRSEGNARLVVELAEAAADALRATVAVGREDAPARIEHFDIPAATGAAGVATEPERRRWSTELEVGEETPAVVVIVDRPDTGDWGGTFASVLRGGSTPRTVESFDQLLLPGPGAITLLDPPAPVLMGRVRFDAVVSRLDVEKVEFRMDGSVEGVRRTAPFSVELDLGPLPRTRRIEAVAFDGQGQEVGRDALLINAAPGAVDVRIRLPGEESQTGGVVRAQGQLAVEVDVDAPLENPLRKLEIFWNSELVGTMVQPPFRTEVPIPPASPVGFVRALATLTDGALAEDVVFVNTPGSAESVDVTLVQLYAVVTDRDGNPVPDLGQQSFRVWEEGERQEIATFGDARDLPLTVGLAIDSSASMFVKLPEVQQAAAGFLRTAVAKRDRAFVVGFGSEPRLAHATTSDVGSLIRGVETLAPDGRTGIWKAIVYSLVQLQGTPGKKALIVYSDGADEDPDFSYRTARRFARLVGVPIYVILSNNEIVRTDGEGLNVRSFLGRLESLVEEVGGRVYTARVGADLESVYEQIGRELRSQYLLGYYASESADKQWRRVRVEVDEPGLKVRTAAGLYR